jgi:CDP-diacylglycerol--glycerol-3-phosphate 3-phosphatidyltransferase
VGSSNFGFRSLHRDLELQFVLVTTNGRLQQALGHEVAALKAHCAEVTGDAHFQAPGRRGGAMARVAVRLLRGLL